MAQQILAVFVPVHGPLRKVYLNNHYSSFNDQIAAQVGTIVSSKNTPAYGKLDAWIDDEGLMVGAEYNGRLTNIINYPNVPNYPSYTHRLYGDGLLIASNEDGETVSLSENIANAIVNQYNNTWLMIETI